MVVRNPRVSPEALEAATAAAAARVHPKLSQYWLRVSKDSASWNRARSHYQDLMPFLADFAEVLLTELTQLQPELDPSDLAGFVTDQTTRARRQLLQNSWADAIWQVPGTSPCSGLDTPPFLSLPHLFRNSIRAAVLRHVKRIALVQRAEFLKRKARTNLRDRAGSRARVPPASLLSREKLPAAKPPAVGPSKRNRPGPKRDRDVARKVSEIVKQVAGGRDWKLKLLDICATLDEAQIPIPKTWRRRNPKVSDWTDAAVAEPELAKKAIGYRLKNARR
jgi:hypothetical protein